MQCAFFERGDCRSCKDIHMANDEQLREKTVRLKGFFTDLEVESWLPAFSSEPDGFRNKAKMVALGAAHQPVLGIVGANGQPVSLCGCPLYPADMQQLLHRLEHFVQQAGIPPYRVDKKRAS